MSNPAGILAGFSWVQAQEMLRCNRSVEMECIVCLFRRLPLEISLTLTAQSSRWSFGRNLSPRDDLELDPYVAWPRAEHRTYCI